MLRRARLCESWFSVARRATPRKSSFAASPSGTVRPSTLLSRIFFVVGLLGVFGVGLGFVWFGDNVASLRTPTNIGRADGAASLTGGSDARLKMGVTLVENGVVPHLLISGVNSVATANEVRQVAGGNAQTFACCIDLGRQAIDTVGNAAEISQWAARKRIKRLILITDNYHMPRSLFEVKRANPSLTIIPFPIQVGIYADKDWWQKERTLRGLGLEYGKFLVAIGRAYTFNLMPGKTP
jgi:uncharacterized SAM-binding protein YcdF (DUF218 family)